MSDIESPPEGGFTLNNEITASVVYEVAGMPLVSKGAYSLAIYPEQAKLSARMLEDGTWQIIAATVFGPWRTNDHEPSVTLSNLTWILPLEAKTDQHDHPAPTWLKLVCDDLLSRLGRMSKED